MPTYIGGREETVLTIEKLIQVTKDNIETSTALNQKMIALNDEMVKLTNGIFWLTIVICILAFVQVMPLIKQAYVWLIATIGNTQV